MEEIEFIVQASAYDVEKLVPQVSRALEKRLQLNRQQMPKLLQRLEKISARKADADRFDKAARDFLRGNQVNSDKRGRQVCFSGEELIIVTGALEDLDQEAVEYDEIEFAMETEDVFLLVYDGHGVLLQKRDLTLGGLEEFRMFLSRKIRKFIPFQTTEQ